jgi:AraC family transcriptional regulator
MGMLDRSSPFGPLSTVQVSQSNIVRRRAAGWTGIQVETVDIIHSAPFEYRAVSPAHMLILTERGSRSDGETMIEGAAKSTLRDFSPRLSLVPVGYRYCGWQKPHVLTRVTYLHIDPAGPLLDPELRFSEIEFTPRLFFQDRDLWETALKLKSQVGKPASRDYAEALGIVLLHELIRMNGSVGAEYAPFGGLAGWQQKRLNEYISAHLADEISLIDLANIAQLSPFHFARAFKRSFGDPPHRYLRNRRIEIAKTLLESPTASVAEIAQAVGFLDPASFTAAFRRSVGTTPTAYRRILK